MPEEEVGESETESFGELGECSFTLSFPKEMRRCS